jgi:hypothetical protein
MSDDAEYDDELPEDDGVLGSDDTLESDDPTADPLDTGISPPERHPASEWYGVTAAEARTGETLDQRLAEEEPDVGAPSADGRDPLEDDEPDGGDEEPDARAGRIVSYDEGAHEATESEYYGRDVGFDGGFAGAEEAAMHVIGEDPAVDGVFDEDNEYRDIEFGEGFAEDGEE